MLNEIREYEEYTWDLNGDKFAERIKCGTLTRGGGAFPGLERFLTIIARHFLYEKNDTVTRKDINAAFAAVRSWLNLKYDEYISELDEGDERIKEIESIVNWSGEYINMLIGNPSLTEKQRNELNKRLKEFRKLEFRLNIIKTNFDNGLPERKTSDQNEITIEKVVANAICRGKLRRFYLCCDGPCFENVKIIREDKTEESPLNEKDRDKLLRFVAVYLLKNYYIDGHKARETERRVVFDNMSFSNWYLEDRYLEWKRANFRYNGKELIEMLKRNDANICNKRGFNKEWLKKYKWTLIDAADDEEFEKFKEYQIDHPEAHFYRDDGAGKPLVKDKEYDAL